MMWKTPNRKQYGFRDECGHIHHSHGEIYFHGKKFMNVYICDEMYMPTNPITVFEY